MAIERVAVVGAGLAGLSAALDLKEAGLHVELFERSRLLGGRATSFEIANQEVDNGQHVFLACCTEFIRFARRVGMESQLHMQERFDARIKLAELPRNSSPTRIRNRCELTGRPRAAYRKFKLSRLALRELASSGALPGVVKSSW